MLNDFSGSSGTTERCRLCLKLCYIAFAIALVLCGIVFVSDVLLEWSGLPIFSLALFPLVFAAIFALAAIVRTTFFARMLQEEEEKRLLERRREAVGNILNVSEDVRFSAARTLKNFEKYLPSVLAVLGFILGGVLLYFLVRNPEETTGEATAELLQFNVPGNPVTLAFLSVICALFAFFSGIFFAGQSNIREFRWLKAVGNMLVFSGVVLFLAAVSAFLYIYGVTRWENYLSETVFYIECVLTIELLANFIMDFYRPRGQEETRPVYESRILALFTEPGGILRNLAASLDYQFGFKVSKTFVTKFIVSIFIPALLVWAFLLWIFTSVALVGPGEMGVRERFGKAVGEDLEPGVHFKMPWPLEQIRCIPVDQVQSVTVGLSKEQEKRRSDTQIILWNKNHSVTDDPFLVANRKDSATGNAGSDQQKISDSTSILETTLPIYFRVKREKIRDYSYNFNNIPDSILAIGKAEATTYFASADFDYAISNGREQVCNDLKKRIQKQCDDMALGVEIISVNMLDAHPPIGKEADKENNIPATNVAEAYQGVVIAKEEADVLKSEKESYAAQTAAEAVIEKTKIETEAEVYKYEKSELAKAEQKLYAEQLKAFRAAPEMFKLRLYLDFIVNDCKDKRKFIVSKSLLSRIYEFNFEDKAKLNLLEEEMDEINTEE